MINPFKLIAILGDINKIKSISKETGPMSTAKFAQYLHVVVSLFGTIGVPAMFSHWVGTHAPIYFGLVAASIALHAVSPSIFPGPSDADKKATGLTNICIIVLLGIFGATVMSAQTTTGTTTATTSDSNGFQASTAAVALHYDGTWSAATHVTESYDFLDWGKSKSNHIYIVGHELVAPTPAFDIYAGGITVEPDLSSLFKKTNITSGTFGVEFSAALGNGVPTTGGSHISALVGGTFKYRATSELTWNAIEGEWVRYGSYNGAAISTGFAYIFGGK